MKLIRTLLATGVLCLSFATTSYIIGRYTASREDQREADFINEEAGDRVVLISDPKQERGGGTGFFVNTPSGNTFILTNNHVCGLAVNDTLLIDGEYSAQIIAHSPDHDLCLISNPLNFSGISVADDSRDGENIYIIGHPLLEPRALIQGQISGSLDVPIIMGYNKTCSKKEETVQSDPDSMLAAFGIENLCVRHYDGQATTANILPGNSGSPVVNHSGQVVGVAFAGREDGPGRGYIVPLSYIQSFLDDK